VDVFGEYIAAQTLAKSVSLVTMTDTTGASAVEIDENVITHIRISKI
jgi:hypothetical protein